jgi:hypothetical protein
MLAANAELSNTFCLQKEKKPKSSTGKLQKELTINTTNTHILSSKLYLYRQFFSGSP